MLFALHPVSVQCSAGHDRRARAIASEGKVSPRPPE
jgi:hypothetical protein